MVSDRISSVPPLALHCCLRTLEFYVQQISSLVSTVDITPGVQISVHSLRYAHDVTVPEVQRLIEYTREAVLSYASMRGPTQRWLNMPSQNGNLPMNGAAKWWLLSTRTGSTWWRIFRPESQAFNLSLLALTCLFTSFS